MLSSCHLKIFIIQKEALEIRPQVKNSSEKRFYCWSVVFIIFFIQKKIRQKRCLSDPLDWPAILMEIRAWPWTPRQSLLLNNLYFWNQSFSIFRHYKSQPGVTTEQKILLQKWLDHAQEEVHIWGRCRHAFSQEAIQKKYDHNFCDTLQSFLEEKSFQKFCRAYSIFCIEVYVLLLCAYRKTSSFALQKLFSQRAVLYRNHVANGLREISDLQKVQKSCIFFSKVRTEEKFSLQGIRGISRKKARDLGRVFLYYFWEKAFFAFWVRRAYKKKKTPGILDRLVHVLLLRKVFHPF